MRPFPHYLEERVFFSDPTLRDTCFKTKSACGLPEAIKKKTDLQQMLHNYASVMASARSFAQHTWYEGPRPAKRARYEDSGVVKRWIETWQHSKAPPQGCSFGLQEMKMDPDALMEEPVMQPVMAFAQYLERVNLLRTI